MKRKQFKQNEEPLIRIMGIHSDKRWSRGCWIYQENWAWEGKKFICIILEIKDE